MLTSLVLPLTLTRPVKGTLVRQSDRFDCPIYKEPVPYIAGPLYVMWI
jgi:hypothetical protein